MDNEKATGSRYYVEGTALIFCVYAAGQLLLHYLISLPMSAGILRFYLLRAPNQSGMFSFVDVVIPSVLLGVRNGRISRAVSRKLANWTGVFLGCAIVGLLPAYQLVMPGAKLWWLNRGPHAQVSMYLANLVWSCGMILIITNAYFRARKPKEVERSQF